MADVTDSGNSLVSLDHSLERDGSVVLTLSGELDMSNMPEIHREIDAVLGEGSKVVVFDLGALGFMDSSGIAMLLQVADRSESVSIRNPPAIIRRILEVTGVSDILRFET